MKVKLSLLLVIPACLSVFAFAQTGVVGRWVGELSAADGHGVSQPITVELKLDGTTLSGTVTEGALEARPIQGATAEGTTLTFRTVRNFGGSDINVNWKGELKGDDLTLTREIGPAPVEAAGGRGGGRGGAGGAGGGRGGRGGAAPAAGGQRGAAAGADVPPVPNADQAEAAADTGAARGGRGGAAAAGGGRGGNRGGAAAGAAAGQGGGARGAPAPQGPTVTLTLHRAR